MSRSLKKGPYINVSLEKKVLAMNESGKKNVVKTDCFRTINNHLLFMISGALLLGKDESIKDIWKKRVLRFFITLVLFSYVQVIWESVHSNQLESFSFLNVFRALLENPIRTPYWFLYSYISFLIMLPFLKAIAKVFDDKLAFYLVIITIFTQDLFPLFARAIGISRINFSVFLNSFTTLSPLLGFYLFKQNGGFLRRVHTKILILCVVVLSVLAALVTIWNYSTTGNWEERYITLFYTVNAICVFEVVQRYATKKEFKAAIKKIVMFVSEGVFGVYLLENIFEYYTRPIFDILDKVLPVWIACVCWLIFTLIIGSIISNGLKRIPGLNKLL